MLLPDTCQDMLIKMVLQQSPSFLVLNHTVVPYLLYRGTQQRRGRLTWPRN